MNAATLQPGQVVTLHVRNKEHRAQYRGHDSHAAVVEVYAGDIMSAPITVPWGPSDMWIADRVTDQAFYLVDNDDAVTGDPPERE